MVTFDRINSDYTVYYDSVNALYRGVCNRCGGTDASPNANKDTVIDAVVTLLGSTGGSIWLKELLFGTHTINDNIIVVEDYQGRRKYISNIGKHLPFPFLTADPSTTG